MNWKRFYLSLSFLLAFLGSGELMAQCGNFRADVYPDSSTCPAQFVQAYAFGGQSPYTYQWSTGATTASIATPSLGTYSVTVQDANGCTTTDTIVVNNFSLSAVSIVDASCGNNNGQIQLSVSGSGPYDLRWYTANWQYVGSGMTLSNVPAGSYTVQAYDSTTQCYESQTYTVGGANGLQATVIPDTNNCPTTSLFASVSGGTSPYSYTWSTGATTVVVNNLQPAQTYTLAVVDANGCADTVSYYTDTTACNQQQPCTVQTNVSPDSSNCPANAFYAQVNGHNPSTTSYYWSGSNSTTLYSGLLSPGQHYFSAYDQSTGCIDTTFFYVDSVCNQQQPCNISIFMLDDSIGCPANWIHAMPSGGTAPYSYIWSNGQTSASIGNLVAGFNYMVTVTDAAGCTASSSYYVDTTNCNQQPVCNMQLYTYSQGCPADTVSAYVWNGAAPYTYSWSTGLTVTTQNNRHDAFAVNGAGLYSLTVTDANGCTAVSSVQVNSQAPMQVSYTINDASCGQNDGAIDLTVSGGDGMYMYSWSNNDWQEDQSNLAPGFYSVYVYDSSGCSVYLDSLIVNGSGTINPSMTPANCLDSLGAIALNPTGFNNPQFVWNTGATGPNLNNLASGVYTVTITDDSCQTARTFFLDQDSSCAIMIAGRVTDNTAGGTCAQGTAEAFRLVRLQPAGIITTTNQYGYYQFTVTQTGNYTVELLPDGVSSQLCPAANINVNAANVGGYYGGNDFVVTHPPVNDLRVNLVHYSTSTPGFLLYTYVYYCNDGNTTQNATITVDYDSQLEFNSTAQNPNYTNAGYYSYSNALMTAHDAVNNNITFTANNLGAGECGLIRIYLSTPTTVALGNQVANSVAITPISGDATPANNTDVDSLVVVGSWDPNEIVLRPTRSGDPRGQAEIFEQDDVLDYTIHFQNLGTAPAYTVVVRDTLDASFDVSSLTNLQFSHPATMTVENGNILVFTFNNINLPDADSDEPGSHGFINYSIDRDPNLPLGSVIPNKAAIYFDFNAPVITNLSEAIISSPTSTRQVELLNTSFKVFPNPSQGQYFVSFEQNQTQDLQLQVYNMQGQLLLEKTQADAPTSGQMSFDLSNFPAAHYLLRINGQDQLIQKQ